MWPIGIKSFLNLSVLVGVLIVRMVNGHKVSANIVETSAKDGSSESSQNGDGITDVNSSHRLHDSGIGSANISNVETSFQSIANLLNWDGNVSHDESWSLSDEKHFVRRIGLFSGSDEGSPSIPSSNSGENNQAPTGSIGAIQGFVPKALRLLCGFLGLLFGGWLAEYADHPVNRNCPIRDRCLNVAGCGVFIVSFALLLL